MTGLEDVAEAVDLAEEIVVEVVVSVEIVVGPGVSVVVIVVDLGVSEEEIEEALEDLEVVVEEEIEVVSVEVIEEDSVGAIAEDSVEETEETSVVGSEEVHEEVSEVLPEEKEQIMLQYTVKSRMDFNYGYFIKLPHQLKTPNSKSLDSIHATLDQQAQGQTQLPISFYLRMSNL